MPTEISGSTGVNKIQDGTIVNADINSSAAIAGSKLVMPSGSVIQTKHMYSNDSSGQSVTSESFIDITNLDLDITPASTSNKVLIQANLHNYIVNHSTNGWNACDFRIVRTVGGVDATVYDSFNDDGSGHGYAAGAYVENNETRFMWVTPIHFLDSPNTTSAITYKIRVKVKSSQFTVTFNDTYCRSSMVLQEIAG